MLIFEIPSPGNLELPPTSSVIQGVDQSKEGQIVIEKNDQGETRARGFNLQPVVVTDDWQASSAAMTTQGKNTSSFISVDTERGFGLKPVKNNSGFKGSVQGIIQDLGSSVMSSVDDAYMKVDILEPHGLDLTSAVTSGGRGFDLQPTEDFRGFSLQPATGVRGLDLKPAVDAPPDSVEDGRGIDLQTAAEDERGFSLQPVVNLLESELKEDQEDEDEDEDTPPPESLQSIKNIARARRSAGKDSLKKSTEAKVTAKRTSKADKERSGRTSLIKEKPAQKKGKGKLGSTSVEKSHLFKPSPSSAPSWSPTPTLRSTRTKVR